MNTNSDTRETGADADFHSPSLAESHGDRPLLDLRSVLVEYEERPDRRTVYPEGLAGVERMSTWLTAADDAFVGLDEMR